MARCVYGGSGVTIFHCTDCRTQLTNDERTYYGIRCELCEGRAWAETREAGEPVAEPERSPYDDWRPARDIA